MSLSPTTVSRRFRACARSVRRSLFNTRDFRRLASVRDYLSRSYAALYTGYCGHNNFGDDIIYDVISHYLYPVQLVDATLGLPIELQMARALRRRDTFLTHLIVGGGTLLNDPSYLECCRKNVRLRRPIHIFGAGVRDPKFWTRYFGAMKMADLIRQWRCTIDAARMVAVRGPLSVDILRGMGVTREVEIIGDPALSTPLVVPSIQRESGLIGLNIGSHPPSAVSSDDNIELVGDLVAGLSRHGYRTVFFALHPIDVECFHKLLRRTQVGGIELVKLFGRQRSDVARISACELIITQRLHGAVIAHAYGVPAVAMVYEPKVRDHMAAMKQEARAVDPNAVSKDALAEIVFQTLTNAESERDKIAAVAEAYRRRQSRMAIDIKRSILADLR